jgi:DNA primase
LAYFKTLDVDLDLAQRVGLIGEKDGRLYDWFRDRVVIPFVEGGRIQFMTGRTIIGEGAEIPTPAEH